MFNPILGEMLQVDKHIFQMGCFNHQVGKNVACAMWVFLDHCESQMA